MRKTLACVGALLACGGGGNATAPVTAPTTTTIAATAQATPTTTNASATPHDARYTLADLRVLAQQSAWRELADHIEDVPPSARDAEWTAIAQRAALGVLADRSQRGPAEGIVVAHALLARYPALRASKDFMAKRAEIGREAFARCFDDHFEAERCAAEIAPFALASPDDRVLAFRLGKLVPPRVRGWYAVPAFAIAIDKKGDARCNDADVKRAVISGLGLPKSGHEDVVAESVALASSICSAELRAAVRDGMDGVARDYLVNTCPFMKNAGLSSLQTKLCDEVKE